MAGKIRYFEYHILVRGNCGVVHQIFFVEEKRNPHNKRGQVVLEFRRGDGELYSWTHDICHVLNLMLEKKYG